MPNHHLPRSFLEQLKPDEGPTTCYCHQCLSPHYSIHAEQLNDYEIILTVSCAHCERELEMLRRVMPVI